MVEKELVKEQERLGKGGSGGGRGWREGEGMP